MGTRAVSGESGLEIGMGQEARAALSTGGEEVVRKAGARRQEGGHTCLGELGSQAGGGMGALPLGGSTGGGGHFPATCALLQGQGLCCVPQGPF